MSSSPASTRFGISGFILNSPYTVLGLNKNGAIYNIGGLNLGNIARAPVLTWVCRTGSDFALISRVSGRTRAFPFQIHNRAFSAVFALVGRTGSHFTLSAG